MGGWWWWWEDGPPPRPPDADIVDNAPAGCLLALVLGVLVWALGLWLILGRPGL